MIRRLAVSAVAGFVMTMAVFAVVEVNTQTSHAQEIVIVEGTRKKLKMKRNKLYLLRGGVFITKLLRAQPGTVIHGLPGSFIVVNQGAKMDLPGTVEQPIVFTSAAPQGTKRRGDWGGFIVNGRAPINVPGGTAQGEGNTGTYGGTNANDSSGLMRYVRVEYGGFAISPENELNCIAFQGVGAGTTIEFVQAAFGGDDGFEFFGGTVNAKNLVSTGASDDSFDWTFGWNGKVQFAVAQQRANEADRAIEADNNENDFNFAPRSSPRLMNFTLVGDPRTTGAQSGPGSTQGAELRRGTAGDLRNFIIINFKNVGLRISDQATFDQVTADTLQIRSVIFFNNGAGLPAPANFSGATANALGTKGVKIMEADPNLRDPQNLTAPDFRPNAGSPALLAANAEPPPAGDTFFTATNFVGAFDANNDWTLGWTNWVFGE